MAFFARLLTKDITTTTTVKLFFDSISYDSRKVKEGTLFFAKGAAFKKEIPPFCYKSGLTWYVAEKDYEVGIPVIIVNDIKKSHEFDCDGILW